MENVVQYSYRYGTVYTTFSAYFIGFFIASRGDTSTYSYYEHYQHKQRKIIVLRIRAIYRIYIFEEYSNWYYEHLKITYFDQVGKLWRTESQLDMKNPNHQKQNKKYVEKLTIFLQCIQIESKAPYKRMQSMAFMLIFSE